jgi:endonuclease G, mitochondrial
MQAHVKIARLKQMLRQVSSEAGGMESLHRGAASEFVLEGTERTDHTDHAANGLEKLMADRDADVTGPETFALEAIILPKTRPVVLVQNGTYGDFGDPWTRLNAPEVRARITPLLRSVGRIELPTNPQYPYGGTAFVVGSNLMLTNRHVARLFSNGLGLEIQYRPGDAALDFRQEYGQPAGGASVLLEVVRVEMIHPFWDMAILRVEGLDGKVPSLPLSVTDPRDLKDEDVVVVGYPARDDRNDLDVQDRVFNRIYNVKRFQPGMLRGRALIQSFENQVGAVTHDSSTLGGNSGSAVIGVKTGKVVGLHFAGEYLKSNYAVPAYELARDPRVVKFGLNFDGSPAPTTEFDAAWRSVSGSEAGPPSAAAMLSTSSWTIPIHVDVSLGAPTQGARLSTRVSGGTAPAVIEGMKLPVIVGNLAGRKGYESDFLGLSAGAQVPLPTLTKRGKDAVARQAGGEEELKYHKFSIVIHQKRRLALFTAANVDWRAEKRLIKGRKPSRKQLTGLNDGDIEKWATDERLAPEDQLPDVFYTKDGGAFDKGHLVRRDDVVWGSSFKDMQKANGDTFHTTNCSPQVQSFNQSARGENNWGDLENLVQQETDSEKAIVFSGPVFGDEDRVFVGRDDEGEEIRLKIPEKFWKVIVVKEKSDAGAYGFVLEQDLSTVPTVEEFAVPTEWRQFTSSIAEIEASLGGLLDLKWLKKRDRFGSEEAAAIQKALE